MDWKIAPESLPDIDLTQREFMRSKEVIIWHNGTFVKGYYDYTRGKWHPYARPVSQDIKFWAEVNDPTKK